MTFFTGLSHALSGMTIAFGVRASPYKMPPRARGHAEAKHAQGMGGGCARSTAQEFSRVRGR